jgi:Spy/CpxP family protein refolding chaperone
MRLGRGLAVAVLVMAASVAQAQGGGMGGGMGGGRPGGMGGGRPGGMGQGGPAGMGAAAARQNEILFKGITLSDAQKAKIDSIQAAGRATMQGMMQSGADMATMRDQMIAMRQAQAAAVRGVLTAEQQAIYDENVAESQQNAGGPGGRRPPRSRR